MTRILVVDDEPQILRVLRIHLTARQYTVITAATGAEALERAGTEHPDVVILDLGLPDLDGVEIIRRLRAWTPVPIIVLSGRVDSHDKVDALDAGADDYVTKPFSTDELLARVRVVTRRRTEGAPPPAVTIGRYRIDLAARTVTPVSSASASASSFDGADGVEGVDGEDDDPPPPVHLTRTEWQLLEAVVSEPGKLVGQNHLLATVWGPTYRTETQYVRQYMAQLRKKLETDPARPRHLLTEPGMGYRFQP